MAHTLTTTFKDSSVEQTHAQITQPTGECKPTRETLPPPQPAGNPMGPTTNKGASLGPNQKRTHAQARITSCAVILRRGTKANAGRNGNEPVNAAPDNDATPEIPKNTTATWHPLSAHA